MERTIGAEGRLASEVVRIMEATVQGLQGLFRKGGHDRKRARG